MPLRVSNAPGVYINEIDRSGYTTVPSGTAVYLKGFTSKGEAYRPMEITTRSSYEQIYGAPDSEAERYTYAAACETLNQGGRLWMARLPYDNESFEKMVGVKYTLTKENIKMQDALTSSADVDIIANDVFQQASSYFKIVDENDPLDVGIIAGGKDPMLYDLSSIDEFRADEARVPEGTFLIVDTTGATYSKVTEDDRKGQDRELVGIVPVVTTAANGLYAQSLLATELSNVHCYEVMSGDKLMTLKTPNRATAGLMSSDCVVRFNTEGYFVPISATIGNDTLPVGDLSDFNTKAAAYEATSKKAFIDYCNSELSSTIENYIPDSISCDSEDSIFLSSYDV